MLANSLINTTYPAVHLTDKVAFVLQLMDDYDVLQLPVVENQQLVGMVTKADLLDEEEHHPVASLQHKLLNAAVQYNQYVLQILKLQTQHVLQLVPVINEQKALLGCIHVQEILNQLHVLVGANEPGAIIVLEMDKRQYSFGEITKLVETNDAYLTQLNTYTEASTGLLLVVLKINKLEVSDVIATFQRYDYVIRFFIGEESYANELRSNYDALMNYLNM
ncbi:MAG: CBS domain-containing protein [Bacteroidetes bacterium]|nr:MAG: CBS domain-containing protein [Bacteroidota bacterium]